MKTLKIFIVYVSVVLFLTGCVTVKDYTLPASQQALYDYSAYSVKPIDNERWRLYSENKYDQTVAFLNSDNMAKVIFWIRPLFQDQTVNEKDAVKYFQEKVLKDIRLSPDIKLTDQSIEKSEIQLDGKTYQVLRVNYEIEKNKYEIITYYYASLENKLLYHVSIIKTFLPKLKEGWESALMEDVQQWLKNVNFKKPLEDEMIRMRVQYAYSDFLEAAEDKYIKEKQAEIQKKYQMAVQESEHWNRMKTSNYEALNFLGVLSTYNASFERYGKDFNAQKAEDYFMQSLQDRKYFKTARLNLIDMYKVQKRYDQAIEQYGFGLKISPNDEDLYYGLGKLYEEKGDKVKAKENYEKAVRFWVRGGAATLNELKNKIKNL